MFKATSSQELIIDLLSGAYTEFFKINKTEQTDSTAQCIFCAEEFPIWKSGRSELSKLLMCDHINRCFTDRPCTKDEEDRGLSELTIELPDCIFNVGEYGDYVTGKKERFSPYPTRFTIQTSLGLMQAEYTGHGNYSVNCQAHGIILENFDPRNYFRVGDLAVHCQVHKEFEWADSLEDLLDTRYIKQYADVMLIGKDPDEHLNALLVNAEGKALYALDWRRHSLLITPTMRAEVPLTSDELTRIARATKH